MAKIIVCDGCHKEAPDYIYGAGWIRIGLWVYTSYVHKEYVEFHICSQRCFNAVMRWKAPDFFTDNDDNYLYYL